MKRRQRTFQSEASQQRTGARPVGQMDELSANQQWFVRFVRGWLRQDDNSFRAFEEIAEINGKALAQKCLRRSEAFLCNLAISALRPLARHAPQCPCLGEDEAVLLAILNQMSVGDRDSASALAALLVQRERLDPVLDAAEDLSAALLDPALRASPRKVEQVLSRHLH